MVDAEGCTDIFVSGTMEGMSFSTDVHYRS